MPTEQPFIARVPSNQLLRHEPRKKGSIHGRLGPRIEVPAWSTSPLSGPLAGCPFRQRPFGAPSPGLCNMVRGRGGWCANEYGKSHKLASVIGQSGRRALLSGHRVLGPHLLMGSILTPDVPLPSFAILLSFCFLPGFNFPSRPNPTSALFRTGLNPIVL